MKMTHTLYYIGFEVEVLQADRDCGCSGQFVVGQVQFHEAGQVEGPLVYAVAVQTTVTQPQILELGVSCKSVLIQSREGVVGQIQLLDGRG